MVGDAGNTTKSYWETAKSKQSISAFYKPVTGKRLYKDIETFLPVCKFFFLINEQLQYSDSSVGMERRLAVIPLNCIFKKAEQRPELINELLFELPGIFNFARNGLYELREHGYKFPEPEFLKQDTDAVHNDYNIFRDFVKGNVVEEDNTIGVSSIETFDTYKVH